MLISWRLLMNEIVERFHHSLDLIDTFKELLNKENLTKEFEESSKKMISLLATMSSFKYALDVSVIIAITDTAGKIIYANEKFCELSKYSREELVGNTHRILNSAHHDSMFFKDMWKVIGQGQIWEGEIKNRAKDGSYYWVKTTIVPLTDKNKKPIMYYALRTDITEGKLAQEKLFRALKNDFRLVVSSMNNLIFKISKDKNKRFIYTLNEGKLSYDIGLNGENMMYKTPQEVFPDEVASMLEEKYHVAFSGKEINYTYAYKGKYLLTYLSPVINDGIVEEVIGCINDITELHQAQEEIEYMAYHDQLTNLPNRRKFNDDISKLLKQSKKNKSEFAVFLIDMNRFKQINDSLGHAIGDKLIKEVAARLASEIGRSGTIYRFAGDEFVIILPTVYKEDAIKKFATKVISSFEAPYLLTDTLEIYSTVSIGVSIFPKHGEGYDDLLKSADIAMYVSKLNCSNSFVIYEDYMNKHQEETLKIEYNLRNALQKNNSELELHFQPKLDLISNKITGLEALLRWNSPILGRVSPSKFIPIAEDTGLIISLDEWVLEKACQLNKELNDAKFMTPVKVAVNISPLHFRLPNFQNVVKKILNKTGLDPRLLEIEITENSFIDNIEECISSLKKLREMGVSVAIDDFGKGYSSLNYLRKFPINSLKIDRTFVQEMAKNIEDVAIVKAITYLAHELNLKVVAEGTETKEVIDVLIKLGCDEVQGYYISRAIPFDKLAEFKPPILKFT